MFRFFQFVLFLLATSLFAQKENAFVLKNGIDKPNITTAHHFGLFHVRINQNFKERPTDKTTLSFTLKSANTFHPFVEMYLPENNTIRQQFSQQPWYDRSFEYIDDTSTPAAYSNIHIDAVFKVLRLDLETKISKNQELTISARAFVPAQGNYPFTFFTNDQSIEWFHSHIADGEDSFGRRFFGMNQMTFSYTDRNNKTIELRKNQFLFAGLEFNYFYYPSLFKKEKNIFVNFGSHFSINTTKYNPSFDIGISGNIHKKWSLKNKNEIRFGIGFAALRKKIISYGSTIDFGNNNYMGSGETNFEFTKRTKKGNYHSFSANYQIQTPYNKKEETEYYFLDGGNTWQQINAGWHNGFTTLYETLSVWSILYNYGSKLGVLSLYIQQDFKLNNAPYLETGIRFKIPISKK